MSTPNFIASPTLSATSNMSSFVMLSSNTHSPSAPRSDDSDDEIIYSVSEDSFLTADESLDSAVTSDNDFVVLSRPKSQRSILETEISTPRCDNDARTDTPDITDLTTGLENLNIIQSGPGRRRRKAKAVGAIVAVTGVVAKKKSKKSQASPVNAATSSPGLSLTRSKRHAAPTTLPVTETQAVIKTQSKKIKREKPTYLVNAGASSSGPSPARSKPAAIQTIPPVTEQQAAIKTQSKKAQKEKSKPTGFGGRSIVDDASDKFSDHGESDAGSPSMYEEAFGFITSFLSNPAARQDSACRLTLLQALIIELGLATSSLPSSLTAAKAYLKSRAFLNISEYIAVRDQGPAAVQRIMHPSRNALIKDLRKNKKKKASLGWVKDSGLQVLLVQCYH